MYHYTLIRFTLSVVQLQVLRENSFSVFHYLFILFFSYLFCFSYSSIFCLFYFDGFLFFYIFLRVYLTSFSSFYLPIVCLFITYHHSFISLVSIIYSSVSSVPREVRILSTNMALRLLFLLLLLPLSPFFLPHLRPQLSYESLRTKFSDRTHYQA